MYHVGGKKNLSRCGSVATYDIVHSSSIFSQSPRRLFSGISSCHAASHRATDISDEFYIFVACSGCRQSTGKLALKETQPDVLVTSRGFEATLH